MICLGNQFEQLPKNLRATRLSCIFMELDSESQHHPKSTLELERHVQLRGLITPLKAKRLASHVEIFVSIRLLFGPPWPVLVLIIFFGSDFCCRFPLFHGGTHLFRQKSSEVPAGHLSTIGTYVPQQHAQMGLQLQTSEAALECLRTFVGGRPIVNAQSFSKPFTVQICTDQPFLAPWWHSFGQPATPWLRSRRHLPGPNGSK